MHDRVVQIGIERLVGRSQTDQTLAAEEVGEHLRDRLDIGRSMTDGGLACIEHDEQLLGQILVGPLTQIVLFTGDALAVVVELGLDTQHRVAELVAFGDEFSDVDLARGIGRLEPLLAAHRRLGARAGLVGNVQLDAATGEVDHAGLELTLSGKPVHSRALPTGRALPRDGVRIVPAVTGACLLLSRALWEAIGGFDEGYVNGGEDIDLGYRARAAGRVNAVALRSVVRHHVSSSPGRKARDEHNSRRLALRWRAQLIADTAPAWCRAHLAAAWVQPFQTEYRVTVRAGLFLAGLWPSPPPEGVLHIARAMRREFARWDEICGQGS